MSYADRYTDKEVKRVEKELNKLYKGVSEELKAKAEAYFEDYVDRYEKEYEAYQNGAYTEAQFKAWEQSQLARGERWKALSSEMAAKITTTNQEASTIINDGIEKVFIENANYSAFEIETDTGIAFNIYNHDAVNRLLREQPDILPYTGINATKDMLYNQKKLTACLTAAIMQGKDLYDLADSFERVSKMNHTSAMRNARTAYTGAQNGGTLDAMYRAKKMGLNIQKEWSSCRDAKVRDSHAELDGVRVEIEEEFPNGLRFPADPHGAPSEVYNCRCTMKKIYPEYSDKPDTNHTVETYKKWLEEKAWEENKRKSNIDSKSLEGGSRDNTTDSKTDNVFTDKLSQLLGIDGKKCNISMLPKQAQQAIYNAVEKCVNKVPQLKGYIKEINYVDDLGEAVFANSETFKGVINVSGFFKDYDTLKAIYDFNVDIKQTPKGTSAESIMIHEIGHQIDGLMTQKGLYGGYIDEYGVIRTSKQVQSEVFRKIGYYEYISDSRRQLAENYSGHELTEMVMADRRMFITEHLSEYAATNEAEFFAECFSEYMDSDSPRETASIFGEILESLIGEL